MVLTTRIQPLDQTVELGPAVRLAVDVADPHQGLAILRELLER